jgi:hypothetical protein
MVVRARLKARVQLFCGCGWQTTHAAYWRGECIVTVECNYLPVTYARATVLLDSVARHHFEGRHTAYTTASVEEMGSESEMMRELCCDGGYGFEKR